MHLADAEIEAFQAVLVLQPVGIMIRKGVPVIAGTFMKKLLQPVQVEEESSINVLSARVREYFLYMHWGMTGVHGSVLIRANIGESAEDVVLPSMKIMSCLTGNLTEMEIIAGNVLLVVIPNLRACLCLYPLQIGRLRMWK